MLQRPAPYYSHLPSQHPLRACPSQHALNEHNTQPIKPFQALVNDEPFLYGSPFSIPALKRASSSNRSSGSGGNSSSSYSVPFKFTGRIEDAEGYGIYLCYAKELYGGDPPADATIVRRLTLDKPEVGRFDLVWLCHTGRSILAALIHPINASVFLAPLVGLGTSLRHHPPPGGGDQR